VAAERLQSAAGRVGTVEPMQVSAGGSTTIRARLDELVAGDPGHDDGMIETGLWYLPGHPVRIHVRRRDGRDDLTDAAAAVGLAGRHGDWLAIAADVVSDLGMNVNRRGVVYVTGFPRRDLADLVMRLAECSRDVYLALLEASD
jgi:hypothetical protein